MVFLLKMNLYFKCVNIVFKIYFIYLLNLIIIIKINGNSIETKIACESEIMTINCTDLIKIENAMYGRQSNYTCPHSAIHSLNCVSSYSYSVVYGACNNKSICSITPSNTLFKVDPCPSTYKYLEVNYSCIKIQTISTHSVLTTFNQGSTSKGTSISNDKNLSTTVSNNQTNTNTTANILEEIDISTQKYISGTSYTSTTQTTNIMTIKSNFSNETNTGTTVSSKTNSFTITSNEIKTNMNTSVESEISTIGPSQASQASNLTMLSEATITTSDANTNEKNTNTIMSSKVSETTTVTSKTEENTMKYSETKNMSTVITDTPNSTMNEPYLNTTASNEVNNKNTAISNEAHMYTATYYNTLMNVLNEITTNIKSTNENSNNSNVTISRTSKPPNIVQIKWKDWELCYLKRNRKRIRNSTIEIENQQIPISCSLVANEVEKQTKIINTESKKQDTILNIKNSTYIALASIEKKLNSVKTYITTTSYLAIIISALVYLFFFLNDIIRFFHFVTKPRKKRFIQVKCCKVEPTPDLKHQNRAKKKIRARHNVRHKMFKRASCR